MNHLLGRIYFKKTSMKIIPAIACNHTFLQFTSIYINLQYMMQHARAKMMYFPAFQHAKFPRDLQNHPKPSHISWVFLTGVSGCSEVVTCTAFRVASTTIAGPFSRKQSVDLISLELKLQTPLPQMKNVEDPTLPLLKAHPLPVTIPQRLEKKQSPQDQASHYFLELVFTLLHRHSLFNLSIFWGDLRVLTVVVFSTSYIIK